MAIFTLVLYFLSAILFISGMLSIIFYLRFQERNQRLPEACQFLDLQQKNQSLAEENQTLKSENQKLTQIREDALVKKAWLETNQTLILSIEEDRKKQEEIKAEYEGYLDKLSSIIQQAQVKGQEVAQLEVCETKLSDEIRTKEETLKGVWSLLQQKTTLIDELDAKKSALLKENGIFGVENETAVRKLRELQDIIGAESDKLQNISAEYASKKAELDTYQTEKDALLKQIDLLKSSHEEMKQNILHASGEQSDEETLKDLWEPIIFPSLPPYKKVKSEFDILVDTKRYIRGKNLYFPDRVIHAFHTSMKSNDISPITVLAGISGTGKSELPKCYAEGMGMHFSMLAVQPRWDSPQDILGFYNYMEKKYKATELARAMVRFDMFNRGSWGEVPVECDDRSDRMLLVLLDEMNLARVEYYFSEFLSKLEARRGVILKDDKDRVKAEIELELSGRAPLRIFPGRNVLFTGTMNEDESTQTLSDKVLDRANVLRFGKPKSANIREKIRNSQLLAPRKDGITYERWKDWCTDAKDVKADNQIAEWIDRLNNAMEELQKPFGHRVAQAITAYVANYPKGIANGAEKELAFADQIEQRIMPKLRGVELESHSAPLEKISKLIKETNDNALSQAFEKGRQDDMSQGIFMWQGIDRGEDD